MDGVGGYRSWRWIFILEGIVTVLIGIAAFSLLADFPAEVKWLTEVERRYLVARSESGSGEVADISLLGVQKFFRNPRKVLGAVIHFGKYSNITWPGAE